MTNASRTTRTRMLVGGIAWTSVVQYFVVLVVVRAAWTEPYSAIGNAISDLGAATCGEYSGRPVCSPLHPLANTSWALTGVAIALGAVLLLRSVPVGRGGRVGVGLLVVTGIGELLVGLNPEDTSPVLHVIAALTTIGTGLVAILVIGVSLLRAREWRLVGWLGAIGGVVGIAALVALVAEIGGHGVFGIVERFAAYPILIWVIAAGIRMLVGLRATPGPRTP